MPYISSDAAKAVQSAARKVQAFVNAANGEESRCAAFDSTFCEPFTDEQRRQVRIYVETWIGVPLQAVLDHLAGDKSFATSEYLKSAGRDQ